MPEIAIDACVFIHLLNPQNNADFHIDRLLKKLSNDKFNLLVDSTGKIKKDYDAKVKPMIKNTSDTGDKYYLLKYWILISSPVMVQVDPTDKLMAAIGSVIVEHTEHADRAFVYVAFRQDATLITNDERHILGRRIALLKATKKHRGKNADILSSATATNCYCPAGGLV